MNQKDTNTINNVTKIQIPSVNHVTNQLFKTGNFIHKIHVHIFIDKCLKLKDKMNLKVNELNLKSEFKRKFRPDVHYTQNKRIYQEYTF